MPSNGSVICSRGWLSFSVKRQKVNISGFVGHVVSVKTTQICLCGMKAAIVYK